MKKNLLAPLIILVSIGILFLAVFSVAWARGGSHGKSGSSALLIPTVIPDVPIREAVPTVIAVTVTPVATIPLPSPTGAIPSPTVSVPTVTQVIRPTSTPAPMVAAVQERKITSSPVLEIPKIGLSAGIAILGLDEHSLQAVPQDAGMVSLYANGPKPGEKGNAVLAGHNEWQGNPGVFQNLYKLEQNDVIRIKGYNGKIYEYTVTGKNIYDLNSFPTGEIYASQHDFPQLNMVTCHGAFDGSVQTYNQRLVIFSRLTKEENAG